VNEFWRLIVAEHDPANGRGIATINRALNDPSLRGQNEIVALFRIFPRQQKVGIRTILVTNIPISAKIPNCKNGFVQSAELLRDLRTYHLSKLPDSTKRTVMNQAPRE